MDGISVAFVALFIIFGGLWLITKMFGERSATGSAFEDDGSPRCPKCGSNERVMGHATFLSWKGAKKWDCGRCKYAF
ncbi:MAG: hypothetical protein AAB502_11615 [Chloroflexota bacterium]